MFYWVGIGLEKDRLGGVHFVLPYLLSITTGAVFCVFGLYAFSAAGALHPLPLVKPAIVAIAGVYLLRAVGGTGMGGFIADCSLKEAAFSSIALVIGLLYAVGAWSVFRQA